MRGPYPTERCRTCRLWEEQELAQENLAKKLEELARSNRDLEQFAYVASHDLQEPLRMVASYTQLLGDRYRGKLDEQADKYIGYAVEGAVRMQGLVHDLLVFSRTGRQEARLKKTDCNSVVAAALQSLSMSIRESGAVILHDPLPAVMGNAVQLQQVFENLIGNAIKFHGKNTPEIRIEAKSDGAFWQFSIQDNGIGVAPQHANDVFTIFKRLHTRAEYPGNGIGLAICKKIVEQHGGKIWVAAHKGPGAIFRFTLAAATLTRSTQICIGKKHHEKHAPSLIGG